MKIQIGKTLITAFVVKILAIVVLVVAVALFGPREAEVAAAWAAETGRWLAGIQIAFLLSKNAYADANYMYATVRLPDRSACWRAGSSRGHRGLGAGATGRGSGSVCRFAHPAI